MRPAFYVGGPCFRQNEKAPFDALRSRSGKKGLCHTCRTNTNPRYSWVAERSVPAAAGVPGIGIACTTSAVVRNKGWS